MKLAGIGLEMKVKIRQTDSNTMKMGDEWK
jgi:hypothetical protein